MNARAHPCQILLALDAGAGCVERLAAALGAAPVASIVIYGQASGVANAGSTKALVEMAQRSGAAALLADDAAMAKAVRADGVHLSAGEDILARYENARSILGKDAIVGVDCGGSRHLAMEAGEAGADYVAFGKALVMLPPISDDDGTPAAAAEVSTTELVQWWSEIFEVPCVALDANDAQEQIAFVEAGADFLGLTIPASQPPSAVADMLRSAAGVTSTLKARS